jgi:ubiquinone/menaquinone biosynthesis C-methylase UbiE
MTSTDAAFAGSIPALYDRCLGPMLFEPFAEDLAARVARMGAETILETAAGTGIVTAALARALPGSRIVATDLNQAMLDVAAEKLPPGSATFQAVDAQQLPFEDASFDAVVCQFGVMFFPDRIAAYAEARRVLKPDGRFFFNAWDGLDTNPLAAAASAIVARMFPNDPPHFIARTPHGYHDSDLIERDLRDAGFEHVVIERVVRRARSPSAHEAATGYCMGTPLRLEIEQRDPARLDEAVEATAQALADHVGPSGLDAPMAALVVCAIG